MKEDEISYRGQMFDIKKQINEEGRVVLVGHYDKLENKLFKLLYKWLDDNSGSSSHQKQQTGSYWLTEALIPCAIRLGLMPAAPDRNYALPANIAWCSRTPLPPFHPPKAAYI